MTQEEFERYQQAAQLKEKIDKLELDLEYLSERFAEYGYPRTESGWQLSFNLNDNYKVISLDSDMFWKCVDVVIQLKREELDKYKKQFAEL